MSSDSEGGWIVVKFLTLSSDQVSRSRAHEVMVQRVHDSRHVRVDVCMHTVRAGDFELSVVVILLGSG